MTNNIKETYYYLDETTNFIDYNFNLHIPLKNKTNNIYYDFNDGLRIKFIDTSFTYKIIIQKKFLLQKKIKFMYFLKNILLSMK